MMTAKKVEGGKGKKLCPSCEKFVGARVKECPHCQHKFAQKSTGKKAAPGSDNEVLSFILAQRGFNKEKLAELSKDAAVQFLISQGSADAAKKAIDKAAAELAKV
jgi:hypothetical protein